MKIKYCLVTASKPNCVTKIYRLDGTSLSKETSANVYEGQLQIRDVGSAADFAQRLKELSHAQCHTYGVPPNDASLITEKKWLELGRPNMRLPRTLEVFSWPDGPGVMLLDMDAPKDGSPSISRKQLFKLLLEACPELNGADLVYWPSASSHICNGDTDLTGLRGQHVYLFVKDAKDIERAGRALNERLWAMGHGNYEVSLAGTILKRSVFDESVWQTNHIDFAAGAKCHGALKQTRGEPFVHASGEGFTLLDTKKAISDLTPEEKALAFSNQNKAREKLAAEAANVRKSWLSARGLDLQKRNPALGEKAALNIAKRALESQELFGDWTIVIKNLDGSEEEITVIEALDNPATYHGRLTLDPIEPDYDGRRTVGKLYLFSSRPNLHSFAHGGMNFRLHRQPARIQLETGKGREATDALLEILRKSPDLYDFGNELVRVGHSGILHPLNEHSLRYTVGGLTQFWRFAKSSSEPAVVLVDPPAQICKNVLSLADLRELKRLQAVITAPTLRPDGSILDSLGYDTKTQLLFDSVDQGIKIPVLPTIAQATSAIEQLWLPFSDFPFCGALDRAVHLAALLTSAVRSSLPASPGFAYDAPIQGSGKTLLARCVGVLVQGTDPSVWPHTSGRDDEEIRKRLFTVLRNGSKALIWDNVVGSFDSPSMASGMTSPTLTDRILGQSNSSTVPNKIMLILTGNNLLLQGEMPRRILVCRIDPRTDKPFARSFDLDPYAYCRDNRQLLIASALTLIRASLTLGCNSKVVGRLASFEEWDTWVRRAVILANELKPGMFGDVMDVIKSNQSVDPDQETLTAVLASWEETYTTKPISVAELISGSSENFVSEHKKKLFESLEAMTNQNRRQFTARSVGRYLGYRQDRIAGGRVLKKVQRSGTCKPGVLLSQPILMPEGCNCI